LLNEKRGTTEQDTSSPDDSYYTDRYVERDVTNFRSRIAELNYSQMTLPGHALMNIYPVKNLT